MPSKNSKPVLVSLPLDERERWHAALLTLTEGRAQANSEAIRQAVYAAAEAKQAQPEPAEA